MGWEVPEWRLYFEVFSSPGSSIHGRQHYSRVERDTGKLARHRQGGGIIIGHWCWISPSHHSWWAEILKSVCKFGNQAIDTWNERRRRLSRDSASVWWGWWSISPANRHWGWEFGTHQQAGTKIWSGATPRPQTRRRCRCNDLQAKSCWFSSGITADQS